MRSNLLISIVITFASLTVIMGGCFYVLWSKVMPPDPQTENKQKKIIQSGKLGENRVIFPLESIVVNLADIDDQKYLRMSIVLELTNEDTKKEASSRLPLIRDIIFKIVPHKMSKDLITLSGRISLCEEIMDNLNLIFKSGSITNIYFTEYIIQ
ncbi:putative Flagellar protein FliL [uncultured Desulfobacterium sp.]|uniref:Flagellar protein FliL n=1 Tax=uncultured Desulfobacterium sp. TaxID=201089 RepID=A0A445MT30_9BACT|nr:putative Flagellar protein FliL [uncultured Desulfobacterium sp.]